MESRNQKTSWAGRRLPTRFRNVRAIRLSSPVSSHETERTDAPKSNTMVSLAYWESTEPMSATRKTAFMARGSNAVTAKSTGRVIHQYPIHVMLATAMRASGVVKICFGSSRDTAANSAGPRMRLISLVSFFMPSAPPFRAGG